jgi:hypothetical protein
MSTGRVLWITWCCFRAGIRALSLLFAVLVPASLAAILLSAGRSAELVPVRSSHR